MCKRTAAPAYDDFDDRQIDSIGCFEDFEECEPPKREYVGMDRDSELIKDRCDEEEESCGHDFLSGSDETFFRDRVYDNDIIRHVASVERISVENTLGQIVSDKSFKASWVESDLAEDESFDFEPQQFKEITLEPHKVVTVVKVPEEIQEVFDESEDPDFEKGIVFSEAARRIGEAEEAAFITGTGVGMPTGVLVDAEVGAEYYPEHIDSDIIKGLIDLFHSVDVRYRKSAVWLMHEETLAEIRKNEKWQSFFINYKVPGRYYGIYDEARGHEDRFPKEFETIFGHPVLTSKFMPKTGKVVAFGDFSKYVITEPHEVKVKENVAGAKVFETRVDGKLTNPEAVKVLESKWKDNNISWSLTGSYISER